LTDGSSPAIAITALFKAYGDHMALRGVDLEIALGERVALVGPNGAGKTTLMKILATIAKPTSGTVLVDGVDLKNGSDSARRKIGLVSHSTFLYNHLTIYENLDFYGKIYDVPRRRNRILEVVERVEMTARLHDRVGNLSRGMQQRVSIARAMLHKPSIMLLDEPETGLDQRSSSILGSALLDGGSNQHTAVIITHSLERVLELGDRVVMIVRGKVAWDRKTAGLSLESLRRSYAVSAGDAA
jgi:heme exporter protein A